MSSEMDLKHELKATKRRDALVRALEFGIIGALEFNGIELQSMSIKPGDFDCLIVVKAIVAGKRVVAFISSDSMVNALLKLAHTAQQGTLRWKPDRYHQKEV